MNLGFHHFHKNKTTKHVSQWGKLIYLGAIIGPFAILPQVLKIWTEKDATGVSELTWVGYLAGAFFWGIYGYVHKEKPIVLANIITAVFVSMVLLGVILYT